MYHLHVNYAARASRASAVASANYILRLGEFSDRPDTVVHSGCLYMPTWVKHHAGLDYWVAADDRWNRMNARLLYRLEFALPRDLPKNLQVTLTERFLDWAARLSGRGIPHAAVPVSYAIHAGFGRNPHVHCLMSTSVNDGHARSAETWFRRSQARSPSRGGAPRSRFMGQRRWLMLIREGQSSPRVGSSMQDTSSPKQTDVPPWTKKVEFLSLGFGPPTRLMRNRSRHLDNAGSIADQQPHRHCYK